MIQVKFWVGANKNLQLGKRAFSLPYELIPRPNEQVFFTQNGGVKAFRATTVNKRYEIAMINGAEQLIVNFDVYLERFDASTNQGLPHKN